MYDNKPRLDLKKIGIISGAVIILIFVGTLIFRRVTNPNFSADEEEVSLEFVSEDSRLAGVQVLLGYGLSAEQYSSLLDKLEAYFDKNFPEFKYIYLVEDSISLEVSAAESNDDFYVDPELRAAIMADAANSSDLTDEVIYIDGETEEDWRTGNGVGSSILTFVLRSNSETEFSVSLDTTDDTLALDIEKRL